MILSKILVVFFIFIINIYKIFTYRIYISPGGLRGFYTYGICKYLKKNYNLSNYSYYGASAGAWNSLFMILKDENEEKFIEVISSIQNTKPKSLYKLQELIKKNILENFDENDFELNNLNICVYNFEKFRTKKKEYNSFNDLEDAIDCCFASSHIPIISGKFIFKYKNKICIDGGLYGFINQKDTKHLVIYPEMFGFDFKKYDKIKNFDPKLLIESGYNDAKEQSNFLEKYI